ncbi:outer membrane immunogenic protein [Afipia massiliensis]|uniref:Outer membrane immunogenic protein n=1 Tax=Afipia massiliensis TaxID=211460 RepID=A0A840N0K4_9BRAD|nr:outer membrane protein [Afipia massiliensis]MBB5051391.1 outer membrane immunogenic protein [Afipia massiliensis]
MRKLLATAAFVAFTITSASAADMAPRYKAPPPIVAPVWSWTGFYAGLHVGGGFSDTNVVATNQLFPAFDPGLLGTDGSGVVGGGQIGYNWQFAPNWLLGIEGDISGTGIRNNASALITVGGAPIAPFGFNHLADRSIDWMASIRGRLGWVWDRWLVYGTGGAAWADVNYRTDFTGFGTNNPISTNVTLSGWVAGGGVEYAVSNNWTVRAEYLYYDFGDETVANPTITPGFNYLTTFDNKIHVVRAGVNYKF